MKKAKTSEDQQVLEENKVNAVVDNVPPESPSNSQTTFFSMRFGIVTLVLAVVGIIISIESLIQIKAWDVGLKTFKDQIEKHQDTEELRLNNLANELKGINARQKAFDKQLSNYHAEVLPLLEGNVPGKKPVDMLWQLQRAYNWLQEAKLDLRWSGDWHGTLLLLQAADEVIEPLNISQLQPVHVILSANIATLSAIQPINEMALLTQIKNISNAVVTLPAPISTKSQSAKPAQPEQKLTGWRATVNSGFEWVQKVVTIKPVKSTQPRPQAQSRRTLNESLIITLQQMQWALLKRDNVLFHWSVDQVIQMIQMNDTLIDLHTPQTSNLLQNLMLLEQQNLAPALPDIQPACEQLKAYMDTLRAAEVKTT